MLIINKYDNNSKKNWYNSYYLIKKKTWDNWVYLTR